MEMSNMCSIYLFVNWCICTLSLFLFCHVDAWDMFCYSGICIMHALCWQQQSGPDPLWILARVWGGDIAGWSLGKPRNPRSRNSAGKHRATRLPDYIFIIFIMRSRCVIVHQSDRDTPNTRHAHAFSPRGSMLPHNYGSRKLRCLSWALAWYQQRVSLKRCYYSNYSNAPQRRASARFPETHWLLSRTEPWHCALYSVFIAHSHKSL